MRENPRICVLTFYRSINPGGILQAYAMQEVLEGLGCTISFLKNKEKKHTIRYTARAALLVFIRTRQIRAVRARINDYILSGKAHRVFRCTSMRKMEKDDFDCFILGSDIIWELRHKGVRHRERYFGIPFKGSKIISYAASAGDSTCDDFKHKGFTRGSMDHIQSISVRDENTKDIIENITTAAVSIVCDPTMLLPPDRYNSFVGAAPGIGRYIVLYLFTPLSDTARMGLREFARRNVCKIVSMTKHETKYADVVTSSDPWSFLTYYKYADYVITDTFHGSIFSALFEKQFVTVERGKNKVSDLLNRLELSDRLVNAGDDIMPTLEKTIDWNMPNRLITEMRAESQKFLEDALEKNG